MWLLAALLCIGIATTQSFTSIRRVTSKSIISMSTPGTYHLHVKLVPTPERRDEFIECIRNNQRNTLMKEKEPGCMLYKWGECTTESGVFYFTEQYVDEEAFKHHTKQDHFAEWEKFASSENAFVSDPVVRFWVEM